MNYPQAKDLWVFLDIFDKGNMNPKIEYHSNGVVKTERYYLNGKLHRDDGPAYQYWNDQGTLIFEVYAIDGVNYNSLEKYYRELYKMGLISREELFINIL